MSRKASAPTVSFFAFQDIITSVVGIFVLISLIMMLEMANHVRESRSDGNLVADAQSAVVAQMESEVKQLKERLEELRQSQASLGTTKSLSIEEKRKEIEQQIKQTEERLKQFRELQKKTGEALKQAEVQLADARRKALEADQKRDELKKMLGQLQHLQAQLDSINSERPLIYRDQTIAGKSVAIVDLDPKQVQLLDLSANQRRQFSANDQGQSLTAWLDKQPPDKTHYLLMVRPGADLLFSILRNYFSTKGISYGFDVIGKDRPLKMRSEMGNS